MNAETKIEKPQNVYAKIAAITGILAKHGIGKNRTANFGKFRGIDDVYNALAPLLSEYNLSIMPRMVAREVVERRSSKGNALFYTTVEAEFDFVSVDDGSHHTVRTFGEAMDSGDKSTNKAMSAAYKYAAFMTFCIPTEGDPDAEVHEVASQEMPEAEFEKLKKLIKAAQADVPAMLRHLNIDLGEDDLRQLTQNQYAAVTDALNMKLSRAAKADTNAKATENA